MAKSDEPEHPTSNRESLSQQGFRAGIDSMHVGPGCLRPCYLPTGLPSELPWLLSASVVSHSSHFAYAWTTITCDVNMPFSQILQLFDAFLFASLAAARRLFRIFTEMEMQQSLNCLSDSVSMLVCAISNPTAT